jgi:hypothetical protein
MLILAKVVLEALTAVPRPSINLIADLLGEVPEDLPHTILDHLLFGLFYFAQFSGEQVEDSQVLVVLHLRVFFAEGLQRGLVGAQVLRDRFDEFAALMGHVRHLF